MVYKNVNVDISITPISSYKDLNNKPSINGVELEGNLSSEELGIKADTTDIETSVSTIKSDLDDLGDQVSVIESKIPAESSDSNQLTDKLYLHNNFYTKTQVDPALNLKVNRGELDNYATKQQLETKQDKLTAGSNITISEDGTISATSTSSGSVEIPSNIVTTDTEQTITSLKHFQGGIDLPINSEFMVANSTTVFKHNGYRLLMGATTDPLTIQSWTNPKINRNGTDYENIDSGNISEYVSTGSSSYELPTASTTTLGGVKVDGTTITIDGNGVISSTVTSSGENSVGGPASWGNITGDISSQSDLQEELNKKVNGVGITSVIRLTQEEYDSLQSIDENAQYIIVGETSTQGGDYISTSSVVTSLDENVTDDQIPSAKLVYDLFMSVEQQLSEI